MCVFTDQIFAVSLQEDERSKEASTAELADAESESNEIRRFELLRHELIELEKRVQRSTNQPENDEVSFQHLLYLKYVHIIKFGNSYVTEMYESIGEISNGQVDQSID